MREQQATDNPRLSIDACRRLLPNKGEGLSDLHIEQLRDQLYALARTVMPMHDSPPTPSFDVLISSLPESDIAELEERAAIIEFDGGLSRDQAERLAFATPLRRKQ